MGAFTENQASKFEAKASKENYFANFVHCNSHLSITYVVPQDKFLGLKVPMWSTVKSVVLFENNFIVEISIFNDANLYDIETALKYDLITFK